MRSTPVGRVASSAPKRIIFNGLSRRFFPFLLLLHLLLSLSLPCKMVSPFFSSARSVFFAFRAFCGVVFFPAAAVSPLACSVYVFDCV